MYITCETCNGNGKVKGFLGFRSKTCVECGGWGRVYRSLVNHRVHEDGFPNHDFTNPLVSQAPAAAVLGGHLDQFEGGGGESGGAGASGGWESTTHHDSPAHYDTCSPDTSSSCDSGSSSCDSGGGGGID